MPGVRSAKAHNFQGPYGVFGTSRKSSRSLSSLAFFIAAQASWGSMSATRLRSNLRFSLHSIVLWPSVWQFLQTSGGSLGTINSWVTFLFTDTAGALEHAGLSAFGLGVTVLSQLTKYSTKHSATTHASSPQLKQGPVLRGSVHSALE